MCGLAGRFHPAALTPSPEWRDRARHLLAHRGPDGAGEFADAHCELVHRRLALLDLSSTGHQPMTNETGSIWVVFNGEIYNHRALRADLRRRGHTFRGSSDTEVLVHLYEEHGSALVHRLRGIFAFAIYDQRQPRLLLARDQYGVKPLFHARVNGEWIFASEIKAITALPGFRPRLDRQACYDFLGLGYIPEPATGFVEIHALPKGTTLLVTPDAHWLQPWDEVNARPDPTRALDEASDALADRLLEAVTSQSAADVPVAALLSGGIDSSLVVAAYRRAVGIPPRTFNVRFPDRRHDETPLAQAVAAHCGTQHITIDPDEHAMATDTMLDLMRHFDQPFADTSFLPMYWVASAIRGRGIICALSGDGGDEAFGGYARFWRANRLMQLLRAPRWLRGAVESAGRTLAPWTRDWGRQVSKAVHLSELAPLNTAAVIAGLSNYLSEEQKEELVEPAARHGLQPSYRLFNGSRAGGVRDLDTLSRHLTETLFDVVLPSDMLRKVDMMSMRAGVEVRVPLLDPDVVALGLSLPHRLKTDGARGKLVLRALAGKWLTRGIARQRKHGFNVPLDVMVPEDFHDALADLLNSPHSRLRPLVRGPLVRQWIGAFAAVRRNGRGGRGGAMSRTGLYQRVFMLLALELWMRDHALTW